MTDEEKYKLIKLSEQGLTDAEIGEQLNYSMYTVRFVRRSMGIIKKRGRKSRITDLDIERMRELHKQGLSYEKIAHEFDLSPYTVVDYIARKESRYGAKN